LVRHRGNNATALSCTAHKWLFSMVDMEIVMPDQLKWSEFKNQFKDQFKEKYMIQTNDKLIIEGLSNLVMKLEEATRDLINCINDT
jgi:hypothetical protein